MAKKNEIVHSGKVIEINPDFTAVEIMVSSACSECHAKGLCCMSEMEEKIIMVPTDPYESRKVGDIVQVKTKMTMGFKAIWISYVIPLVILMILVLLTEYGNLSLFNVNRVSFNCKSLLINSSNNIEYSF